MARLPTITALAVVLFLAGGMSAAAQAAAPQAAAPQAAAGTPPALEAELDRIFEEWQRATGVIERGRLLADASKVAAAWPDRCEPPLLMAEFAFDYGDYASAESFAKAAVALDARSPVQMHGYRFIGLSAQADNRLEDAVGAYRESLKHTAEKTAARSEALVFLASPLALAERYGEAEAALREAVDADASHTSAWKDLGKVLAAQDRYVEAIAACRKAAELDPTDEAAKALVDMYEELIRKK